MNRTTSKATGAKGPRGRSRGRGAIWARDSTWKTPTVSAALSSR